MNQVGVSFPVAHFIIVFYFFKVIPLVVRRGTRIGIDTAWLCVQEATTDLASLEKWNAVQYMVRIESSAVSHAHGGRERQEKVEKERSCKKMKKQKSRRVAWEQFIILEIGV